MGAGVRGLFAVTAALLITLGSTTQSVAQDQPFEAGSLIIPMDTNYQDAGMLQAFGLVYQLILQGVEVNWVIQNGKAFGDADFVTDATDWSTLATISAHGYRGGPFVIDLADVAAATPIITAWKLGHTTTVHVATAGFVGHVKVHMVAAPKIAIFADGHEDIAMDYLNAAGIPDSTGAAWTAASPDALTVNEVRGLTDTVHDDGALFDGAGRPAFCEFMSMHWGVKDRNKVGGEEVVAEVRSFLRYRTHFCAECQAVNAFENAINGRFLTTNGFLIAADPSPLVLQNQWYPFAQLDGGFTTVGGSERSYSLPPGDVYKGNDIVMMTKSGTTPLVGQSDLWMTGYLDAGCSIADESESCMVGVGKISYLGGHSYEIKTPITANLDSQGTRLFLNSLFEADCVTDWAAPYVQVTKTGPGATTNSTVSFTFDYANFGSTTAFDVVISDTLPAGMTFVSATGGGTAVGGVVTWHLGGVANGAAGSVTLTVSLAGEGVYSNTALVTYFAGNTPQSVSTNAETVDYQVDTDNDGCSDAVEGTMGTNPLLADTDLDLIGDCVDNCPLSYNPAQDLSSDINNCGACYNLCDFPDATSQCIGGSCRISVCDPGFDNCDFDTANGCETSSASFATDLANCGGCGLVCATPNGTPACLAGLCSVVACETERFDCDELSFNGCEKTLTNLQTDLANCGACDNFCSGPNAIYQCVAGACSLQGCQIGFHDCDLAPANGCETTSDTLTHDANNCGTCGIVCMASGATAACVAGLCQLGTCDSGLSDCDQDASNGCEFDTSAFATDPNNCGACNHLCAATNATTECQTGSCIITECADDTFDIDADPSNGCEYACEALGEDTNCDNIDDDCDGVADNGFAGSCGVGACKVLGTCADGVVDCVPGTPSIEGVGNTCTDRIDNDCDGITDQAEENCLCSADLDCDDLVPCTLDVCGQDGDCTNDPAPEETACDNGESCEGLGRCRANVCEAVTCDDVDADTDADTAANSDVGPSDTSVTEPALDVSVDGTGSSVEGDATSPNPVVKSTESGCGCQVLRADAKGERSVLPGLFLVLLAFGLLRVRRVS